MTRSRRVGEWAALLVAATLSGCNQQNNTSPPLLCSATDYDCLEAKALCNQAIVCGGIGASEVAGCESFEVAGLRATLFAPSFNDGVAQGKTQIDFAKLNDCFRQAHDHPSCSLGGVLGVGLFCLASSVTGTGAPGAACLSSAECAAGFCDQGAATGRFGCSGTCKPWPAENMPCTPGDDCGAGDYCDQSHICVAELALGQPCTNQDLCAAGFCSIPPQSQNGTCRAFGHGGDPCTNLYDCADGLFCDNTQKCAALPSSGAACDPMYGCTPGNACATVGGMLRCTPWLDAGGACDPSGPTACPQDMQCDPVRKACTRAPIPHAGDACANSGCQSGLAGELLYCNDAMVCAAPVAFGMACTPSMTSDPCLVGACDPTTKVCALNCS